MSVCCECVEFSGRGLYDEPITCPEESYRACACACVCVCVSLRWIKINNNPIHKWFLNLGFTGP